MIRNKEWLHYKTRLNCNLLSLQLKEILKLPNLSGISIFHRKCIFRISSTNFVPDLPLFFLTFSDTLVNMNVDSALTVSLFMKTEATSINTTSAQTAHADLKAVMTKSSLEECLQKRKMPYGLFLGSNERLLWDFLIISF